jgi:sodium transport system permease protein
MRWSIIRLIWLRELRDQLRDRRTVLMMAVLPLLLYPALGFGVFQFALTFATKTNVVGIYGAENLSPDGDEIRNPKSEIRNSDLSSLACFATVPVGLDRFVGAAALVQVVAAESRLDLPPLLVGGTSKPHFAASYFESPNDAAVMQVRLLDWAGDGVDARGALRSGYDDWLDAVDRSPLESKQVDALLIVPPHFWSRLQAEDRPALYVLARDGDDRSRLVSTRVHSVLQRWKKKVKEVRLARHGLPPSFDDPVAIRDNDRGKSLEKRAAEELFDILVRVYPFVLVMWSLAGALYPAVDTCAGEKERGTMETLLISPASRDEIVIGKFLTIWVFSAATALLNLASMGVTAGFFSSMLPHKVLGPAAIAWSVALVLPLAAFFSAICLAVGAYARSTKEGQYYLMPLFLITTPLVFLTLAPGVELSPFYSLVPVTGVALLLQKLIAASSLDQAPWLYFLPVLAPMVLYGWFALRWAIEQFKREEVLFREAERLEIGLWLRRLFRDKEPLPSTGQALACFVSIVVLYWISLGVGGQLAFLARSGIGLLAFVAAPTLLMALLMTTQPALSLGLRPARPRSFGLAALLAVLLLLPLSEVTVFILQRYPGVMDLLAEHNPLTAQLKALGRSGGSALPVGALLQYLLVLAVLPALAEELAFRGFILSGLRRRFRPGMAVVLSSFLFALYHFNVFQFVPSFVLGLVLGTLAVRCGSILPAMLFHLLHNGLLIGLVMLEAHGLADGNVAGRGLLRLALVFLSSCLAVLIFGRLVRIPVPKSSEGDNQLALGAREALPGERVQLAAATGRAGQSH